MRIAKAAQLDVYTDNPLTLHRRSFHLAALSHSQTSYDDFVQWVLHDTLRVRGLESRNDFTRRLFLDDSVDGDPLRIA